ncbi:hypothetical protein BD413DRAFT_666310, partial [Trametes elegans]
MLRKWHGRGGRVAAASDSPVRRPRLSSVLTEHGECTVAAHRAHLSLPFNNTGWLLTRGATHIALASLSPSSETPPPAIPSVRGDRTPCRPPTLHHTHASRGPRPRTIQITVPLGSDEGGECSLSRRRLRLLRTYTPHRVGFRWTAHRSAPPRLRAAWGSYSARRRARWQHTSLPLNLLSVHMTSAPRCPPPPARPWPSSRHPVRPPSPPRPLATPATAVLPRGRR